MDFKEEQFINIPDILIHDDSGPWRSYELETSGRSTCELVNNALIWMVDQDGAECGFIGALERFSSHELRIIFLNELNHDKRGIFTNFYTKSVADGLGEFNFKNKEELRSYLFNAGYLIKYLNIGQVFDFIYKY